MEPPFGLHISHSALRVPLPSPFDSDRIIRVMPEPLANKIAAGEVVQRPSSALKELVENSLDAGAERIDVLLKGAGRDLIQVIDDGGGMGRMDAAEAFRRHATSKIRSIEDLERIRTLGFRGEALASLAAVAQVELRTRRMQDPAGTRVRAEGGIVGAAEPVATPAGTSIAARNLFFNVPARRAFLKSPATEFRHLVETFQTLALSHPEVSFSLVHDDADVYRLRALASDDPFERLAHRIGELFGRDHEDALVRVEEATSYLTVRGFVARPERHRRTRGEQFVFVNERYVKSRALEHAALSAYEGLLPDGAYPFFALFLDLDPAHVDVNVHPAKAEVKFDDERGVYSFARAVVRRTLAQADLVPAFTPVEVGDVPFGATLASRPADDDDAVGYGGASAYGGGAFGANALGARFAGGGASVAPSEDERASGQQEAFEAGFGGPGGARGALQNGGASRAGEAAPAGGGEGGDEPPSETVLFQLHDAYILTPIRSGLMILDQRAAHERVLYEKALATLQSGLALTQQLLFPHTLEFRAPDLLLLKELMPHLTALGFDVEFFSGRSVVVRGVPADVRAGDERAILEDLLDQFRELRETLRLRDRETLARTLARRSAIRAGQKLSVKEMRALIDQLFSCEMPYSAPDGRPTMIKILTEELARRFGG